MEQKFIKLTVGTINTRTLTFPFLFDNKIELKIQLPIDAFDAIYQAFSDRMPLRLTVADIECAFDCSIIYIEKNELLSSNEIAHCTITVSSFTRLRWLCPR